MQVDAASASDKKFDDLEQIIRNEIDAFGTDKARRTAVSVVRQALPKNPVQEAAVLRQVAADRGYAMSLVIVAMANVCSVRKTHVSLDRVLLQDLPHKRKLGGGGNNGKRAQKSKKKKKAHLPGQTEDVLDSGDEAPLAALLTTERWTVPAEEHEDIMGALSARA